MTTTTMTVRLMTLCRLKQGECDVIDNDVMDSAACFTLADGRGGGESRDLTTFDPLQSTLAHRFRSYAAPGGGYTLSLIHI